MSQKAMTRASISMLLALMSIDAQAKTIDIALGAGGQRFSPEFLWLQTDDKIRFAAANADHIVTTISGMLPDGVSAARQKPKQTLVVTLTKDGVYGFACCGGGAVALIVAGKPANEGSAKTVPHPAAAQRRFTELFARLDGRP